MRAARARGYRVPQRVMTVAGLAARLAACRRATNAKTLADETALGSIERAVEELGSAQRRCVVLVNTAHSAGLMLLATGSGPILACGRDWCVAYVEAAASVKSAQVQTFTTLLQVEDPEPGPSAGAERCEACSSTRPACSVSAMS